MREYFLSNRLNTDLDKNNSKYNGRSKITSRFLMELHGLNSAVFLAIKTI